MRYAKDEKLLEISNRLVELEMGNDQLATQTVKDGTLANRTWKYVNYFRYGSANATWLVKFYFGRQTGQLIIGRTGSAEKAIRFSDCANVYFWKYRHDPSKRPITNVDLNLGFELASRELANNAALVYLLHLLEAHLVRTYALVPSEGKLMVAAVDVAEECRIASRALNRIVAHLPDSNLPKAVRDTFREAVEQLDPVLRDVKTRNAKRVTRNVDMSAIELTPAQVEHTNRLSTMDEEKRVADANEAKEWARGSADEVVPLTEAELEDIYKQMGLRTDKGSDTTNSSTTQ